MHAIDIILEKLSKSKFRSSFKLKEKDFVYIDKVGIKKYLTMLMNLLIKD